MIRENDIYLCILLSQDFSTVHNYYQKKELHWLEISLIHLFLFEVYHRIQHSISNNSFISLFLASRNLQAQGIHLVLIELHQIIIVHTKLQY